MDNTYIQYKLSKKSFIFKQCSLYISNKSHVSSILESFENCSPHSWFSSCTFITSQPSGEHCTTAVFHAMRVIGLNDSQKRAFYLQAYTNHIPIWSYGSDNKLINFSKSGCDQKWVCASGCGLQRIIGCWKRVRVCFGGP